MKVIPIGIARYTDLIDGNYYFVDKTEIISSILERSFGSVTLFTRPRRFGKSLTLSMINDFFKKTETDKTRYFENTKIWNDPKARKAAFSYPTIYLDLKDLDGSNSEEIKQNLALVMSHLYKSERNCIKSDLLTNEEKSYIDRIIEIQGSDMDLGNSLFRLIYFMSLSSDKRPLLLVDEYDSPINKAFTANIHDDLIGFYKHFYGKALKGNPYLGMAILTGVMQISKESLFSGLNNLFVDSVYTAAATEGFGFTESEVQAILDYYHIDYDLPTVKKWYGGYRFGKHEIYNPWSILNFISEQGNYGYPWLDTAENPLADMLFKARPDEISQVLSNIARQDISISKIDLSVSYRNIYNSDASIESFLLATGYLTIKNSIGPVDLELGIPNLEIEGIFGSELRSRYTIKKATKSETEAFKENLEQGEDIAIANFIEKRLLPSFSYFDLINEKSYQLITVTLLSLVFGDALVTSEPNTGKGRCDIMIKPLDKTKPAYIIEIKFLKGTMSEKRMEVSAKSAIKQIKNQDYPETLRREGIADIRLFGIAYSQKKTFVCHEKAQ